MKFLDYERIIRDNYPILVESYVKQYGERYRNRINNVLNKVKYCIFVTPDNILEYVKVKTSEDYIKGILDSFVELGVDISGIRIVEEGSIECTDQKVGQLLMYFFPDIEDLDNIKKKGIYSFSSEFDNLDLSSDIVKERMILLENLNLKDKSISYEEYFRSPKYLANCIFVKQYLKVFERNINKWLGNYDELLDYADGLDMIITDLSIEYEIEFLKAIRKYLPEEDVKVLDGTEGFDVRELGSYGLFFDLDLAYDDYRFTEGPFEYFLDFYTERLLDEEVSFEEKEEIVKMRLKYFDDTDFEIKYSDIDELFCDWYQKEELKDILPDKELLSLIVEVKDKLLESLEYESSKLCIINDYVPQKEDAAISTIGEGDGHSCSLYMGEDGVLDSSDFSCVICLNPFMDTYNLFDIAIDHELRHAIEWRLKNTKSGLVSKIGCDIVNFDVEDDCNEFTDINERITHKLSVESTHERWENNQFIFSDKYALITDYPISIYDYDFDNLAVIFEPFRDKIISAQIGANPTKIYETIPRRDLLKVNELVTSRDEASFKKLCSISNRLQKREEKKNGSDKVKKLGGKHE